MAEDDIEHLNQMNLIPEIMKNAEYTESVTRIEFLPSGNEHV